MGTRPFGSCDPGCDVHYGCRLRNKGLQVSPRAQMTKTQNWRPTPSVPPSYNKQIVYDERPGGTKVPVLKADGSVLRRKEFDEKRHTITDTMRRIRTSQGD